MDVDDLFTKTGEFGPYQIQQYLLLSFPILLSSYQTVSYIFTTGQPAYRCKVPECEDGSQNCDFNQPWVSKAIPLDHNGEPDHCLRYEPVFSPDLLNESQDVSSCYPYSFNKQKTIKCNSWIIKDNENTIVTEFNLMCSNDSWKVALVGTMNYLGFFVGMPVSGIFADRYGRKKVLVISCLSQSVIGVLRSLSPNYEMYLSLQFLGAFMSGAYNAGFVLGLEIVGPGKRVLGNAIICCFHSFGEAVVGILMWILKDWRYLLRYLFIPGLFSFIYLWIIPESIRWLLAKGKTDETIAIFNKMAKVNKKELPSCLNNNSPLQFCNNIDKSMDKTEKFNAITLPNELNIKLKLQESSSSTLTEIFKSTRLMIRLGMSTFCWMVITMVFFGSSLISVAVGSDDKYINFILTILVELPGYLSTWLLMDVIRVGRRPSLVLSFLITSLTCIVYSSLPGAHWLKLVLFLLGKFSITFAFAVVYIFTAEMFPTEVRNSLLGVCSMAGHIGSMIAPQTMLLSHYIEPVLLWGIFSLIAGVVSMLFPETLNSKLPDTVEEAERIGQID